MSLFGRIVGEFGDFFGEDGVVGIFYEEASGLGFVRVLPWKIPTPHPMRDVVARCDQWPHIVAEFFR